MKEYVNEQIEDLHAKQDHLYNQREDYEDFREEAQGEWDEIINNFNALIGKKAVKDGISKELFENIE